MNEDLKKALEFYADPDNWEGSYDEGCNDGCCSYYKEAAVVSDNGAYARRVLSEYK